MAVVGAGFVGFEITWRGDVFSGAAQSSSAAKYGELGPGAGCGTGRAPVRGADPSRACPAALRRNLSARTIAQANHTRTVVRCARPAQAYNSAPGERASTTVARNR